jgi:hypothetical protein
MKFRLSHISQMQRLTDAGMTQLGGTTEVARLVKAPVSTVHSWKRSGISDSRLDHLKLRAEAAGIEVDWTKALEDIPGAHDVGDILVEAAPSPNNESEIICRDGEGAPGGPFGPISSGTSRRPGDGPNPRPCSTGTGSMPEWLVRGGREAAE